MKSQSELAHISHVASKQEDNVFNVVRFAVVNI